MSIASNRCCSQSRLLSIIPPARGKRTRFFSCFLVWHLVRIWKTTRASPTLSDLVLRQSCRGRRGLFPSQRGAGMVQENDRGRSATPSRCRGGADLPGLGCLERLRQCAPNALPADADLAPRCLAGHSLGSGTRARCRATGCSADTALAEPVAPRIGRSPRRLFALGSKCPGAGRGIPYRLGTSSTRRARALCPMGRAAESSDNTPSSTATSGPKSVFSACDHFLPNVRSLGTGHAMATIRVTRCIQHSLARRCRPDGRSRHGTSGCPRDNPSNCPSSSDRGPGFTIPSPDSTLPQRANTCPSWLRGHPGFGNSRGSQ